MTIVTTYKTSGKTITPSFTSFDSLLHDYSESNSFINAPIFDLGGGLSLRANQRNLLSEALPFGIYYDKTEADKPLERCLLTRTLTPSVINGLTNEGFENPRYTAALDPQFSCFTFSCPSSQCVQVGDAENTFNAPCRTGFHIKPSCLVFIDRNGLVYPVTFHLVMLLIALSVHVPKSIRAMAISNFDEVSPMDMPLRLQTTYHPARICWLHDPDFFNEFGVDMSQYTGYYGMCAVGIDPETLSQNASSFPSHWDSKSKDFSWTGPTPRPRAPVSLEYTPQSGKVKILTTVVSSFSQIATKLAEYFELGEDIRHLLFLLYSAYPSGMLGAFVTVTIAAFLCHCTQVFLNIFSFLSFGLGTAFGYVFLNKPVAHNSFFSPLTVAPASKRKLRAQQYAPQSGEGYHPDAGLSEDVGLSSPSQSPNASDTPSANSMKHIGGTSIPVDAKPCAEQHVHSCISAFQTRSSALPCTGFGSSSRSPIVIAGGNKSSKTPGGSQGSDKSISSQTTVPTSNSNRLSGFGI